MRVAVLDLNDQALLIKTQDGEVFSEPGFALHTSTGIITGTEARNEAWLQPQNVYRQYWRDLNQNKLPGNLQWARHNADIAFAQLKNLLLSAGSPEQLVVSVAATFDDEQLSLLLGLLSAIPTTVISVVDSSLADCMGLANSVYASTDTEHKTLHIDLHLYQSVVSQMTFTDNAITVTAQRVFPEIGAMHVYTLLANHIRDKLVKDFRFDPLDAPQGEQAIYNLLPDWILRFASHAEYGLVVSSPRGDLPVILHKSDVLDLMESRLGKLSAMLRKHSESDVTFSSNAQIVSILTNEFHASRYLRATQGADNCLKFIDNFRQNSGNLHRITHIQKLPGEAEKRRLKIKSPGLATHLLYDGQAWPLNAPLSITIENGKVQIIEENDDTATAVMMIENNRIVALHKGPQVTLELPHITLGGMELHINDYRFELIEVCSD